MTRRGGYRLVGAIFSVQAAIRSQLSAQARQVWAHSSIPSSCSQLLAHSRQMAAHAAQVCLCSEVLISIVWAEVRQISAHAIISLKCSGSTCAPPASRQWFIASAVQVA